MNLSEVIAEGAAWGDRFVAFLGVPRCAGWLGVEELFGPELSATLAAVGAARGTESPSVAGALLFEQYAQRLVAPVLGALHRDGDVLDARLSLVRAEVVNGALRRLAFARAPEPARGNGESARATVTEMLVADNLDPFAEVVHRHTGVGVRVLRGAMANAVASALLHMSWAHNDRARYVAEAVAFLDRVPGFAELVNVDAVDSAGETWMYLDRNTCCLYRKNIN